MNKKKILFVYHRMQIGGSTSSLLSLLDSLDETKYEIHLALFENTGELLSDIPKKIRLIKEIKTKSVFNIFLLFMPDFWKAVYYKFLKKKDHIAMQLMARCRVFLSKKIKTRYDAAIGFLECWPSYYVCSKKVSANVRICWIHTDYEKAGFNTNFDYKYFSKANYLVSVSEGCKNILIKLFPIYKNKIIRIDNIVSNSRLTYLSNEYQVPYKAECIRFIVICRMDIYTKGLDRLLSIFDKLEKLGYVFSCDFVGSDIEGCFERLMGQYNFKNEIRYLGQKLNPYPYLKNSDICLQLSRFEGKPLVVDESMVLGVPVLATNYNSAHEQINNNVNGMIFDNNYDSIFKGIKYFLDNTYLLKFFKDNLKLFECSRTKEALDNFDYLVSNKL